MSAVTRLVEQVGSRRNARRVGAIGLHFSEQNLHAIQLKKSSSGQISLQGWASMAYPEVREEIINDTERLKLFCRQVLRRGGFSGRKVVAAMAPEKLKLTSLKYSLSRGVSEEQEIIRLMAERLDDDIGNYVLDYVPIRSNSTDMQKVCLVAASRRDDVIAYLESLRGAGLEVEALEISPVAINRLVSAIPAGDGAARNVMVINYGGEKSFITVISGRRLLLDQSISFGENMLLEKIGRALDLSRELAYQLVLRTGLDNREGSGGYIAGETGPLEMNPIDEIITPLFRPFIDDICRAARYAASESKGGGIDQVYTFGSVARWPGADRLISRLAKVPVADALPLETLFGPGTRKGGPDSSAIGPDLAVAAGLALRGLTADE